jgi:hypothetical protein
LRLEKKLVSIRENGGSMFVGCKTSVSANEREIGSTFSGNALLCTLYKFGHSNPFFLVHNASFGRFVVILSFLFCKKSQDIV